MHAKKWAIKMTERIKTEKWKAFVICLVFELYMIAVMRRRIGFINSWKW